MKKLLALLLAGLMMLSFAACGTNDNPSGNEDNPGISQSGENNDNQGGETIDWPSEHSDIAWTGSGKILAVQEIVGTNQVDIYIDVATLDEVAAYIEGWTYTGEGEAPALAYDEEGEFHWQGTEVRIALYEEPQGWAVVRPGTSQLTISVLG